MSFTKSTGRVRFGQIDSSEVLLQESQTTLMGTLKPRHPQAPREAYTQLSEFSCLVLANRRGSLDRTDEIC